MESIEVLTERLAARGVTVRYVLLPEDQVSVWDSASGVVSVEESAPEVDRVSALDELLQYLNTGDIGRVVAGP
jgi:hypothetical protein